DFSKNLSLLHISNRPNLCCVPSGGLFTWAFLLCAFPVLAQESNPFTSGHPLGLMVDEGFQPMSSNVKVYGAIYHAESCIYDADRDLLIVPSQGVRQNVLENDAWVSLINTDGTVHTPRWIGQQNPAQRKNLSPALVFNDPLGSEIAGDVLYFADREGGISENDPSVAVIRRFDLQKGTPLNDIRIDD